LPWVALAAAGGRATLLAETGSVVFTGTSLKPTGAVEGDDVGSVPGVFGGVNATE